MCSVCLSTPCHPRCPNAPEPKPVYECSDCGYGIYEGQKFFDSPRGYICEDCIKDMSAIEFMELMGEKLTTAERED